MLMLFLFIGLLAIIFTYAIIWYAKKNHILDIPNERSSHLNPTPRGGGLAVVISFFMGFVALFFMGFVQINLFIYLSVSIILVSYVGWIDDKGHVKASLRLLVHFLACASVLYACNGLPPIDFFYWEVDLGFIADIMALFFLVWLLNLYNFMDGIDGIAASQALISSFIVGLIIYLGYDVTSEIYLHWLLSISILGFLLFNFPPAKIFMGDVGSGFIGLILGALTIVSANLDPVLLWVWLITLAVFVVDSSYTLIIRFFNGAKIYEAHNLHAYQIAARRYKSHRFVTTSVILINFIWLTPIAVLVSFEIISGAFGVILSYFPLILIARYYKAGIGK